MRPSVLATVVIATRNRPGTLVRALESLLAQELGDWEAIVVDDGDGEGLEAARALADPRIAAVPNAGTGMTDGRNTAIVRAAGELVCWLDDDDAWTPDHLGVLREAAVVGAPAFFFRGGWMAFEDAGGRETSREIFDHAATPETLRRDNTILTSSIAYPRAAHRAVGLLDREVGSYCDWDFMLRLCDQGLQPVKLPGLGVRYAVHDGGASAAFDAPRRRRDFERFKAKHGLDVELANHVRIHRMLSDERT